MCFFSFKKKELSIQIVYTQIDRGKKEKAKVKFTDHTFNLDPGNYFYPASTVKLPVAILALQRLNELKIPGLDRNSTMITREDGNGQTEILNDPSAADGRPTIAHYIKKILLVSDNDAFNRLYEFLGPEYINTSLHEMGYTGTEIIHRLSVSLTEEQNRHTNPVTFFDTAGKLIYTKPAEISRQQYPLRNIKLGKGFMQGDQLINEPFDFSKKNQLPLYDLHRIVRSIFFTDAVPKEQQFNLDQDDYNFLRLYLSMRPGESTSPVYNPAVYWDNYVKMLFYGAEKTTPEPGIRIFNKTGTAYGFLTDACYFVDFKNNIEFLLSVVIYCNSDSIFNDDKYDYSTTGYPFLKNLGRVIYEYELKRERKNLPDFSSFQFSYSE
ncbi:MAG: serine hydrolase [Chitinophagaceae bacterium]|nr:serine hydrolase [Chitinophagaceae bacterium]